VYPFESSQAVKQKLSVSELKKRMYMEQEGEEIFKEEDVIPLLPKFLQEETELTGASRGTAYHKLLELLDFSKDYDEGSLLVTVEKFVSEGFLSEEMAACIDIYDIQSFLRSSIGKRVQAASRRGTYHAEQPFVMSFDANRIYADADEEQCVLVQGIVDVYFEEDGQLVVLDYKTDRVREASELVERYHTQLDYYAEALHKLTGKPVKEKVIYSFALHEEISC
jgi:ATP-dependent helicase/nuclease subunit A